MQQHAATLFAEAEAAADTDLPPFVKDEFDAFLECAIPAHGLLRLRCGDCGHDKLVVFSCKTRVTNRDIRSKLKSTRLLSSCVDDSKQASAKIGRCFRRLHAHDLIAKIPRTRRWRVTTDGRNVMGTTMYLREHHFPNAYSGLVH